MTLGPIGTPNRSSAGPCGAREGEGVGVDVGTENVSSCCSCEASCIGIANAAALKKDSAPIRKPRPGANGLSVNGLKAD